MARKIKAWLVLRKKDMKPQLWNGNIAILKNEKDYKYATKRPDDLLTPCEITYNF